ncbi:MAG: VOC family protein [Lentisphaeria bacterium]|nr:VOC family protein [Lentisphaeria bacterium]
MPDIEVQGFDHVAIWVTDLRKSADWYIEHLGLQEASVSGNHIFLKMAGGQVLALFEATSPEQVGSGVQHIALTLAPGESEKALHILKEKGFPLERRGHSMGFPDPDGYWIHFK